MSSLPLETLLLTVAEAGQMLKCERTQVFELIKRGVLARAPKFGKKTCVYAESVFAALEKSYDPPPPAAPRVRRTSRTQFAAGIDAWVARARGTDSR